LGTCSLGSRDVLDHSQTIDPRSLPSFMGVGSFPHASLPATGWRHATVPAARLKCSTRAEVAMRIKEFGAAAAQVFAPAPWVPAPCAPATSLISPKRRIPGFAQIRDLTSTFFMPSSCAVEGTHRCLAEVALLNSLDAARADQPISPSLSPMRNVSTQGPGKLPRITSPDTSTHACSWSSAPRSSAGRTAKTTQWPMPRDRKIQLRAIARGRHLVENGKSLAAQSTCAAKRRASAVSGWTACAFPPNRVRHRLKGSVAMITRAQHRAARAVPVRSRDVHRSGNNQAKFLQLQEEFIDVRGDLGLFTVKLRR
jgi:hypothetical protein